MATRYGTAQAAFRGSTIGDRERTVRNRLLKRTVGLLLLVVGFSIVHVWSRMEVLGLRYQLTQVQQRIEALSKAINQAETVVASKQSVERLTRIARKKLGMAPPQSQQVVQVQVRGHRAVPRRAKGVAHP